MRFSLESWLNLPIRLLWNLRNGPTQFSVNAPTYLGPKYPRGLFGAIDCGEETAVNFFNEWNAQVVKEVPKDRLLVFEVKEGWEPLCKFLGVPVPEEPFPNLNDTKMQQSRLAKNKKAAVVSWSIIALGISASIYFLQGRLRMPTITFSK